MKKISVPRVTNIRYSKKNLVDIARNCIIANPKLPEKSAMDLPLLDNYHYELEHAYFISENELEFVDGTKAQIQGNQDKRVVVYTFPDGTIEKNKSEYATSKYTTPTYRNPSKCEWNKVDLDFKTDDPKNYDFEIYIDGCDKQTEDGLYVALNKIIVVKKESYDGKEYYRTFYITLSTQKVGEFKVDTICQYKEKPSELCNKGLDAEILKL